MTIEDPLFGKYFIEWDDCYTVIENGVAKDKITGEEKPKETVCGYYSTRKGAVLKICNLLTKNSFETDYTTTKNVATLREVVERNEKIWEDIKHTLPDEQ